MLQYGIVGINEGIISTEMAPFGGMKESGSRITSEVSGAGALAFGLRSPGNPCSNPGKI
jgi:acyl-CoA reductase-like NAD-dependent aldehyde dehydrogenase